MGSPITRREFCHGAAVLGAAGAMLPGAAAAMAAPASLAAAMPRIKLGSLEVSRLILGSNPFFGFSHGNPQASPEQMKAFFTDERVMAVLDDSADHGITAVWTPCYDEWVRLWNAYREKGGKLTTWIAQPDRLPMEKTLKVAFHNGAKAVCIQGCQVDDQINAGHWDVVRGWLELIKAEGLPAGIGTHGATTHLEAEERGLPTDFYHQTLYRPDNYVPAGLEESLATIARLTKPVMAYKVLGAGRFLPKDVLPYVFRHLKPKDGICLGTCPRTTDEVSENARLTRELSRMR